MLCKKYMELSPLERSQYIGEVAHCLMSDDSLFQSGQQLRELGHRKGLFDNVTINPPPTDQTHDPEISSIS